MAIKVGRVCREQAAKRSSPSISTRIRWAKPPEAGATVFLYRGSERIGGARAHEVLRLTECESDEQLLRRSGMSPSKLFVVDNADIDPEHRGVGHGKVMYEALFDALAEKYGLVFVAPYRCRMGSGTSPMAERVWRSLSRTRPSSGVVLAIQPRMGNPSSWTRITRKPISRRTGAEIFIRAPSEGTRPFGAGAPPSRRWMWRVDLDGTIVFGPHYSRTKDEAIAAAEDWIATELESNPLDEPPDDADDETFIAWMDAIGARKERGVERLRQQIEQAIARGDVFTIPNVFPRGGYTIVHRSTKGKPGVPYQITWMDDDGPVGDTEPPTLQAAAERVWDDIDETQRDALARNDNPRKRQQRAAQRLAQGGR